MSLSIERSTSKSFGPGIYVDNAKIIAVEDKTGEKRFESTPDLYIAFKLSIPGLSFEPSIELAGNFGRDNSGVVKSWGGAFPIRDLLTLFDIKGELNTDYTIPDTMLETLVGKDIMRLTYVSKKKDDGKLAYNTWNKFRMANEDDAAKQDFADSFLKELEKTGYPKNYHPELLNDRDIVFPPVHASSDEDII